MRTLLSPIIVTILLTTAVTFGQSQQVLPLAETDKTNLAALASSAASSLWFVELASPPTVEGSSAAALDSEESDFHRAASGAGIRYRSERRFRRLWNGLTVRAALSDVAKLRDLPGVRAVYPVARIEQEQIEQPAGPVPDLATALAMTGADVAQKRLGLSGRGVRVAVIDSGLDYDHPDLGGCFGTGCRVEKGYDLVGDDFNADPDSPDFNPTPSPDPFPDDCGGHGTHVSGIIGASGTITGVAPGVTFHAYRVFGCAGSTTTDIIVEALERAFEDGADVVNMSIGAAFQWPQDPSAQAANRLARRGITVVASIGNTGTAGLYAAGAPGVGREVIGVASFDNTHVRLPAFTVSPDDTAIGYSAAAGAPLPPQTGTFPLTRTGTPASLDDACAVPEPGSLAGTIALIRRGTCGFAVKAANAQAGGAAGVIIYNNVPGHLNITVAGPVPITIPVVFVTASNGTIIDDRIASGSAELTWTSLLVSEEQATGGLISGFSSFGLPPDLGFKPDLGAPGGSVRSTLPLELGGHGNNSGTSMASPHVAGAVALLLEARPHTTPREVQARLQNTAFPVVWGGNPALGFLDNVHRQGAGLIDIDEAILAEVVVSPSNLALGEIEQGSVARVLAIARERSSRRRGHADAVTYTVSHQPALATGANTFVPTFLNSFATVAFSSPTVSIGGEGADSARLLVTFTPPANAAARLFGGYIVLTPDDGGPALRVPYAGYNGDYQAIPTLVPTPAGLPWLARLTGNQLVNQPNGATFTLVDPDLPFIVFHLDHPVRVLSMEVIEVSTGESFKFADFEEFVGRNAASNGVFLFPWDGTTTTRSGRRVFEVPDGTYRIELSVLKALGDRDNPAHVERWSSPEITLARPPVP